MEDVMAKAPMKKIKEAISTPQLIASLEEGDTFSRSKRIPVGSEEAKNLNAVLTKLRNNVNQGATRARAETGSNFRVESGVMLTDDKTAHLCTVAVTRLDGDDEEVDI
jgi:hypothetical protein